MMQSADSAALLTRIPTVDRVLNGHVSELGNDLVAYRNHVYRVVNLCLGMMGGSRADLEKVAVAAVFHDLGIWTDHTFDYIAPSLRLAREHLEACSRADWIPEIEAMIVNHHKVTPSRGHPELLAERFRRADWIDVTRGLRDFGVPRALIATVFSGWPSAGFHRRLATLTIDRFWRHPLAPLPMVRW